MTGTVKHLKGWRPSNTELLQMSKSCFHKNRAQRASQSNIHERAAIAKTSSPDTNAKIWNYDYKTWTVGAPRWTSSSALARQITWLQYYQTAVDSFEEKSKNQIRLRSAFLKQQAMIDRHSAGEYSTAVLIYSKKAGGCIKCKWW